jgi:hypothetical protein
MENGRNRPFVGLEQIARGEAQHANESVGALEIDHVGGKGLGELRERSLDSMHGFERRQVQIKTLAAGAGFRHAHEMRAVAKMKGAIVVVLDGG